MSIVIGIIGWILFLILTAVAILQGIYLTKRPPNTEFFTPGWYILLVWVVAIVSKILWIESIWSAIGIWLIVGITLGFIPERIFWARLSPSDIQLRQTRRSLKMPPVLDLRSPKERQIELDAYAGVSLGSQADTLVSELIDIGRRDHFGSEFSGGKYNAERHHIRAKEIGELLYELDGMKLMQAASYRVRAAGLYAGAARELDYVWDGMGSWRA